MKKTSKKIVFFGNERLATAVSTTAPTLRALVAAGYEVCAVVANHEAPRSRKTRTLEIATVAEEHNIPLLTPGRLHDIAPQLEAYGAIAGVLVAYGKIVPQNIIDVFPRGIINIHPSLLPRHRGPIPIESILLAGEKKTGVSLMQLRKEMDAGPLYAQVELTLSGTETKQFLANTLLTMGAEQLIEHLPKIIDGSLQPTPQDNQRATYDKLIQKQDGVIDWQKHAAQIEREIRAYAEWPKTRASLGGEEVIITHAHVSTTNHVPAMQPGTITVAAGELLVTCGGGTLSIERLKPAGKPEMDVVSFLAGYGKSL